MSEGFNLHLERINKEILNSPNLLKLLYYNSADALEKPNLTDTQKNSLIYSKIFPYRFIPNLTTEANSYLNIGFSNFKMMPNNSNFQVGKIGFYAVCHKDLWRMNGGLRPIFMMEEIKGIAKNLGRLQLIDVVEYAYNNDFLGYVVLYDVLDFNK